MTDTTALATIAPEDAALAAEAATTGDLSKLPPEKRSALYGAVCRSVGLNPLTQPFQYITLNGKLTLYAAKTATDQLRKVNGISITRIEKEMVGDVLMVTAYAQDKTGRTDSDVGAVSLNRLTGDALANAHMKAITKAKRRVTLSIAGLGWLDESEVDSIPADRAQPIRVDIETGEIQEPTTRQNGAGRAEPQKMTPDTQARQTPHQRPAQQATATVERMPDTAPDVLTTLPPDLLEAIATDMWKKDSWADMSASDRNKVRKFVEGKGPEEKQQAFDQFVSDWEDQNRDDEADEDGVIDAEVVDQSGLFPNEDELPTPKRNWD